MAERPSASAQATSSGSGRGTAAKLPGRNQAGIRRRIRSGPVIVTDSARRASIQVRSPRQISTRLRSGPATVAATSCPGSASQTSTSSGRQHDPPLPLPGREVGEVEPHHRRAGWHQGRIHVAVQVPHQQLRVEVDIAEHPGPAHPPGPEQLDRRAQLLAGPGRRVDHLAAVPAALDHAAGDQLVEALRQQGRRHPGQPSAKIVEVPAAGQQLPDHQQGPALVEQLHRLGDRAELVVRGSHDHDRTGRAPGQARYRSRTSSRHPTRPYRRGIGATAAPSSRGEP